MQEESISTSDPEDFMDWLEYDRNISDESEVDETEIRGLLPYFFINVYFFFNFCKQIEKPLLIYLI